MDKTANLDGNLFFLGMGGAVAAHLFGRSEGDDRLLDVLLLDPPMRGTWPYSRCRALVTVNLQDPAKAGGQEGDQRGALARVVVDGTSAALGAIVGTPSQPELTLDVDALVRHALRPGSSDWRTSLAAAESRVFISLGTEIRLGLAEESAFRAAVVRAR